MRIFCLFVLGFALAASAQQTITSNSIQQIGESYTLTAMIPDGVSEGSGGANQTWNFQDLRPNGQPTRQLDFVNPADTPFGDQFPNSNNAQFNTEGDAVGYTYWELTSDRYELWGLAADAETEDGSVTLLFFYDDPVRIFNFPFSFGDTVTDTFSGFYDLDGINFTRTGDQTTTADGFGTILLPDGKSFEALRIVNVQNLNDTATFMGISLNTNTTTTSYLYYVPGERQPALTINYVTTETMGFEVSEKTVYLYDAEGDSTAGNQRYLSHITRSGGGFLTELILRNESEGEAAVTLTPYDSAGNALTERLVELIGNETTVADQGALFGADDVAHVGVEGNPNVKITMGYRAINNGATAHLHQESSTAQVFRIYPGEPDVVFDGMALVNQGDGPARITAKPIGTNNDAEIELTSGLSPGAKYLFVFDSVFPEPPPLVEIRSDQPASAIFLRGSRPGTDPGFLFVTEPQQGGTGDRWIPHVTRDGGGFVTNVFMHNTGAGTANVTVTPYDDQGQALAQQTISLTGDEVLIQDQTTFFNGQSVSHFKVTGSSDVIVSAGYKSIGEGATAHFHESTDVRTQFQIYQGEVALVFDGMALVNTGDQAATVTADLVDAAGNVLLSRELSSSLGANQKLLAVFDEFIAFGGSSIRIVSDQPAAVVFLRGTRVGTNPAFLYTNPPIPQ